jgi:hypothetical protein
MRRKNRRAYRHPHLADWVFRILVQAKIDHRRNVRRPVFISAMLFGAACAAQRMPSAGSKPSSTSAVARRDLRRQHLGAKAQMRGNDPAALRHAGDFGFLHIVTEGNGGFGQNFGGRHDALTADTHYENIGNFRHSKPFTTETQRHRETLVLCLYG